MPEKSDAPQAPQTDQAVDESGSTGSIQKAWEGVQSILNHLVEALNQLKTVQVSTLAADLELMTEKQGNPKQTRVVGVQPLAHPKAGKVEGFVTEIDMLQGDIRHFRSKEMPPPLETQLKDVHTRHVEMAQKIFLENLRFAADTVHRFWQNEG